MLAIGDPLTLDLAALPSAGNSSSSMKRCRRCQRQFGVRDPLSGASFSQVGGHTSITFSHGGRIAVDGVSYTCLARLSF